jgi:hypothetical protein
MFKAVLTRFDEIQAISDNCSAQDIDADVILFWDVNSSHHIQIDGIKQHKALKIEYWSDPHQHEIKGIYQKYNLYVHKLGAEQRVQRMYDRGVEYIICPLKHSFYRYFGSLVEAEKVLWHFPVAPSFEPCSIPLLDRKHEVLGNGAYWGDDDTSAYAFRRWAFQQPCISFVEHCIKNKNTPNGTHYIDLLKQYSGGLALDGGGPVVKYFEMPLAGMVVFVQYHEEYKELGFIDHQNCIYVTKENFERNIQNFKEHIEEYQSIATAGMNLMSNNYTAKHFADFVYKKCEEVITCGRE